MDDHTAIVELFGRFARAVEVGDSEGLDALWVADEPADVEGFERNSEKVRARGWSLSVRAIDQQGDVAAVTFVVKDDSVVVDEAELTVTREGQGWRIRAL